MSNFGDNTPSYNNPASPPPPPMPQPATKGFFGALFDFSFNHFVTPMIVKVVYILFTIALGLTWLVLLFSALSQSFAFGLIVLVLGAIVAVIYLALVRMTLEFYLAVVRMSEDIHKRLPQG